MANISISNLDAVFFYAFALLAVGGAIFTITRRSAVHSAVSLIVSLLGVAGLYLLQRAEFLFAVQIVLYVGGIMLLFLFVIMLVNLDEAARQRQFNGQWWIALACLLGVAAEAFLLMRRGASSLPWSHPASVDAATTKTGNTEQIADILFSEYLLPFEVVSLLLLVAVIGSVFMARKRAE
ncbi:MAG TPA: NADH-quinone oxidoreductase subunit J [Bryobacteraceae bacterium]|nr:NADH-quinone oxidoreductase subunit J [Bryobacteraceae bacterium]